jgi:3-isopropylmalate dehydrogenase
MSEYKIGVMAGDGIGPEIVGVTLEVLDAIGSIWSHNFLTKECLVGGAAFEVTGSHLPEDSVKIAKTCDAILFGSVGGPIELSHQPKWKDCERNSILALRQAFNFNINLRPVTIFSEIAHLSPLKSDRIQQGVDFIIVRELLGDLYFGEHSRWTDANGLRCASDQALYREDQIVSVAQKAFTLAKGRRKNLCLVHKANVLEISRLWQEVVREVAKEFPTVTFHEMLVDNCAMQLVREPSSFDVVLTSNLFGDILSDLAAALPGSLGVTPSASINSSGFGLYEPSGGSAPDIAGKGTANPLAQMLSLALLLDLQLNLSTESKALSSACRATLKAGIMTRDLDARNGVDTKVFSDHVINQLKK